MKDLKQQALEYYYEYKQEFIRDVDDYGMEY